jgi:hypothetical protein
MEVYSNPMLDSLFQIFQVEQPIRIRANLQMLDMLTTRPLLEHMIIQQGTVNPPAHKKIEKTILTLSMGQNFPSFRGMTGDPSNGDTTVEAVGLARGATFLRQKLRSTH